MALAIFLLPFPCFSLTNYLNFALNAVLINQFRIVNPLKSLLASWWEGMKEGMSQSSQRPLI